MTVTSGKKETNLIVVLQTNMTCSISLFPSGYFALDNTIYLLWSAGLPCTVSLDNNICIKFDKHYFTWEILIGVGSPI